MKKFLLALSLVLCGAASFFAACGPKTYTFSFDTDGGNAIDAVVLEEGKSYDELPTPQKEGYKFLGWYLSEDLSGEPVDGSVTADGNKTFYAAWEKLGVITLDLNGGTLSGVDGNTLYCEVGSVIYDFMSDYVPVKNGSAEFGAWFVGDNELGHNDEMTEAVTLTAQYKYGYTIEVWLQDEDLDGYTKSDEVISGSDYVGAKVVADVDVEGYTQVSHEGEVLELTLTENASANVLKVYLDRETYTVAFDANYPGGESAEIVTEDAVYGVGVKLPHNYTYEGYFLTGWAETPDGEAVYGTGYIDSIVYNSDGGAEEEQLFYPDRNCTLYGVWEKGYEAVDLTAGYSCGDYIYLFDEAGEDIYLCRGDRYFIGRYNNKTQTFAFFSEEWDETFQLNGVLDLVNRTFIYVNEQSGNYSAVYYSVGGGVNEKIRLLFDFTDYVGIVYRTIDEAGNYNDSKGTYEINEDGDYVVTFTDGDLTGETMTIRLVILTNTSTGETSNGFMVRNEEEAEIGQVLRAAVNDEGDVVYYRGYFSVEFDGFGNVEYGTGSDTTTTYSYVMDEDMGGFRVISGSTVQFTAKFVNVNGTRFYVVYDEDHDRTYTAEDGSTLTTDGLFNATYTPANGQAAEGYYTLVAGSVFGGEIVYFYSEGAEYAFIVDEVITSGSVGEDGKEETVYNYTLESRPAGYIEYTYWTPDEARRPAPLLVLNDSASGSASAYGYNEGTGKYVKVSSGTYTFDENSGRYSYNAVTVDADADIDVGEDEPDLRTVKSVVFGTGVVSSSTASYNVNYWYTAEIEDGSAINYSRVYTSGEDTLSITASFATIEIDGNAAQTGVISSSAEDGAVLAIGITDQFSGTTTYYYVRLNEADNTFTLLDQMPYSASRVTFDGMIDEEETLAFDGLKGAVYTADGQEYAGTFADSGEQTSAGYDIYNFSADGKTFKFILLTNGTTVYFEIYNDSLPAGMYVSSGDYGRLQIDGFGATAVYTDADGNSYEGLYSVADGALTLYTENGYIYFDLISEGGSYTDFKVRGAEYGNYVLLDNQYAQNLYFELDGYGGLKVFTAENNDEGETERNYIDENGSYVSDDEGVYTLSYTQGGAAKTLEGTLGVYNLGSGSGLRVFVVGYEDIIATYIDPTDWSILILDAYGNVRRYDEYGSAEYGSYTIITDDLLYYVNTAGTDASLYEYDTAAGTITPVSLRARSYYTMELESLQFTEYGFAIFNGDTRCYYEVGANNNVTIYTQEPDNVKANEYGFVASDFGTFGNTKEYEGKTYYMNDGYSLTFERKEATADKYPVLVNTGSGQDPVEAKLKDLVFVPSGGTEFTATASVSLSGLSQSLRGTVVREADGEGGYDTYLKLSTSGGAYFRMDITLEYAGLEVGAVSSYEILTMSLINNTTSATYQMMYYLYSMFGMQAPENTYGSIDMTTVYNEDGEAGDPVLNASFGQSTGAYFLDGTLISVEGITYVTDELTGYLRADFEGPDGYAYSIYFTIGGGYLGTYAYNLGAIVRWEQLTTEDGIEVEIGRVVGSEGGQLGAIFDIRLTTADDKKVEADSIRYIGEDLYVIAREYEKIAVTDGNGQPVLGEDGEQTYKNGKVLSTRYYKIELAGGTAASGEVVIPVYTGVTVTEVEVTTYNTADGSGYVDVSGGKVMLISVGGATYGALDSTYDEATSTYTVTVSGKVFTVAVKDGSAVITEQQEEEAE